jgi:hypothetical protein
MAAKQDDLRFTLHFSDKDPRHIQAAEILNRQGRRSKASYLVEAILHYEHCEKTPDMTGPDLETMVLAILRRVLGNDPTQMKPDMAVTAALALEPTPQLPRSVGIKIEEAINALGEQSLSAIAGMLAQFRK